MNFLKDKTFEEILETFQNPDLDPYVKEVVSHLVSLMQECIQANPEIPVNELWPYWRSQGFAAKAKAIVDQFFKGGKK